MKVGLASSDAQISTGSGHIVTVAGDCDIIAARQRGRELAARLGFSLTDATLIATAISELARNIIEYAHRGEISLSPIDNGTRRGILIVASDRGPGIAEIARALSGGYSTSGGLGLGLCGVRRLMDDFDITSSPGKGTTVVARKWKP